MGCVCESASVKLICAALALPVVVGCGASHELETAQVRGRVSLDGEPLRSGYVMILPSKGRMARGAINEDGAFVMGSYTDNDGAQIGDHPVVVTPVPADEGMSKERRGRKIPKRYRRAATSRLRVTVEPSGLDDWRIELTSSK